MVYGKTAIAVFYLALLAFVPTCVGEEPAWYYAAPDVNLDVEYGSRRPVLDVAGWVVGIPRKLLMLDSRVDNHRVSGETVDKVTDYMARKDLESVKLRVNQWDPIGEWQRLVSNDRVAPGWKYTFGTLHHLRYTFMPGRLFGRDEYNPFTNTVSIYSDVPTLGMVESAYAHDVRQRNNRGAYASLQSLPLVAMWHETLATDDVLRYTALYGTPEEIAKARRILYSRYGSELGGEIGGVVSGADALKVIGAGVGHLSALRRNSASVR